jgi:hypothetical protein
VIYGLEYGLGFPRDNVEAGESPDPSLYFVAGVLELSRPAAVLRGGMRSGAGLRLAVGELV